MEIEVSEEKFNKLLEHLEKGKLHRAEKMPTEKAALRQMFEAYQRLKEMGWNEAMYCPKDGSMFSAIEAGSTGVHRCWYEGDWPGGKWLVFDGDTWGSKPILWRPRKDDDPEIDYESTAGCCAQ